MKKQQDISTLFDRNIDLTISPKDGMYIPGQEAHYYSVGYSALRNIKAGLMAANLSSPTNILDMGCGHGRVLRMLKAYFPEARLTACDIEAEAVDFCAETFGADKAYSNVNLGEIVLSEKFDLIWCGSLLTHLDIPYWRSLLSLLERHLTENGLLLFTAQGRYVAKVIRDYNFNYGLEVSEAQRMIDDYTKTGFGYSHYPSRSDYYGFSVSSPSWVVSFLAECSGLQLCSLNEQGWDDHQDVYACCYTQTNVMDRIEEYVTTIASQIIAKRDDSYIPTEYGVCAQSKVAEYIEARVNEDKMPYGPRVRHILLQRVLETLREKSEGTFS